MTTTTRPVAYGFGGGGDDDNRDDNQQPEQPEQGVEVRDGFLTDEECQHIINLAKDNLERSLVVDEQDGSNKQHQARTSSHAFLLRGQDEKIKAIEAKISEFAGLPPEQGERLQVIKYLKGQEYQPHWDYFDPAHKGNHQNLHENGGQRQCTVLIYLSNVKKGGETVFPMKNISVEPKKGRAVKFRSTFPDATLDVTSLHGSKPVIKGTKWAVNKWFREFPFL